MWTAGRKADGTPVGKLRKRFKTMADKVDAMDTRLKSVEKLLRAIAANEGLDVSDDEDAGSD
jgi:hypothetical protein